MGIARVIGRIGNQFRIWCEDTHTEVRAFARKRVFHAAKGIYAGDLVEYEMVTSAEAVIVGVRPRRNQIIPPGMANLDLLLIVMSWQDPPLDEVMMHRIRIMAEIHRVRTLFVVNKIDRVTDRSAWTAWVQQYTAVGFTVIGVSAKTGEGLDALRPHIRHRVSALAGPSGVGKSSLLNVLIPGARLRTAEVDPRSRRGRHTTTWTTLLPFPDGGWIADTPGFSRRTFPPDVTPLRVARAFPWHRWVGSTVRCQFDDCLHLQEPGCGVRLGVRQGRIPENWYRLYTVLVREAQQIRQGGV